MEALLHKDRRRLNPKDRVDERTEAAVPMYALGLPAHGQVRTSNELRKTGLFVLERTYQGTMYCCRARPGHVVRRKTNLDGGVLRPNLT